METQGIDQKPRERIRGGTIEGCLGTQSKVLKDFSRARVYIRDYRDLVDRRIPVHSGQEGQKRDRAHGLLSGWA